MAILDSMYFLAEFALTVFDSALVFIMGSTYAYMYATIVFGVITLVLAFQVVFEEKQLAWMNFKVTDICEQNLEVNSARNSTCKLQNIHAAEIHATNGEGLVKKTSLEIVVDDQSNSTV